MALESVHLLGLALLGGAACIIALAAVRRTGLHGLSIATLAQGLRPLFAVGLLLMIVSGALIVLSMPFKCYLQYCLSSEDGAARGRHYSYGVAVADGPTL